MSKANSQVSAGQALIAARVASGAPITGPTVDPRKERQARLDDGSRALSEHITLSEAALNEKLHEIQDAVLSKVR